MTGSAGAPGRAPGARPLAGSTVWVRTLAAPVRAFIDAEAGSASLLLAAALAALLWANSPWGATYAAVWSSELAIRVGGAELALDLRHWINDGLMALFFFVIGLEIRRELDLGELRQRRRVAVPVVAAVGGMAAPALLYLVVTAGGPAARGWGLVMATDTAFALGALALVARRGPPALRVFLLTLAIVDDVGALAVIALGYSAGLAPGALLVAAGLFGLVLGLRALGVRRGWPYAGLGVGVWLATLASGVHPTLAGVALGLLAPARRPARRDLQRAAALWRAFREQPTPRYARSASRGVAEALSPNERLQALVHPWSSYLVVPLFALANAGVVVDGELLGRAAASPVTLGVVVGLVAGKPLGITVASWLATRRRLGGFPLALAWPSLVGLATVAGIGFTVSLFIADLAFAAQPRRLQEAKLGILGASLLAAALGGLVFRALARLPARLRDAGPARPAAPPPDLADAVDPDRDHVRGPAGAPVTLVEYGDFECPYCGRAEPAVRALVAGFGDELRFVFRHLPLTDVHEHAQLAAEAAEAAGAQGKFWEMHDRLFAHQDALSRDDLEGHAAALGLDVGRFAAELRTGVHAPRVARDVDGADASGVAGTPTFFVNGRRHDGAYDLDRLTALVRAALVQARPPGPGPAEAPRRPRPPGGEEDGGPAAAGGDGAG
jgi:Na+/H+ antiporter NhaA